MWNATIIVTFFSPKGPLFNFLVLRQIGCWKIPKGPPVQFFDVLQQWMLRNAKGSLFQGARGPALAGTWRASSIVWVFREFDTSSILTLSCPFAILEPDAADLYHSRLVKRYIWPIIRFAEKAEDQNKRCHLFQHATSDLMNVNYIRSKLRLAEEVADVRILCFRSFSTDVLRFDFSRIKAFCEHKEPF